MAGGPVTLHEWMRFVGCLPLLLVLTACNPPLLDETSSESRVRIDEGRVFTIALPSAAGETTNRDAISSNSARIGRARRMC